MDKTRLAVIVAIFVVITGFIIYDGMYDDTAKVSTTPTSTPVANTSSTTAEIEAKRQRDRDEQIMRDEKEAQTVAFKIDVAKLPTAQQLALKTVGVSSSSIDITNAMVACARFQIRGQAESPISKLRPRFVSLAR
mgnify:FL=1